MPLAGCRGSAPAHIRALAGKNIFMTQNTADAVFCFFSGKQRPEYFCKFACISGGGCAIVPSSGEKKNDEHLAQNLNLLHHSDVGSESEGLAFIFV